MRQALEARGIAATCLGEVRAVVEGADVPARTTLYLAALRARDWSEMAGLMGDELSAGWAREAQGLLLERRSRLEAAR